MPLYALVKGSRFDLRDTGNEPWKPVSLPVGFHELEEIPHPGMTGDEATKYPWLVLKGTKIGEEKANWEFCEAPVLGRDQVILFTTTKPLTAKQRRYGGFKRIYVIAKGACHRLIDATDPSTGCAKRYLLPAGYHELEEISNPLDQSGRWLVLKGTQIGADRDYWFAYRTRQHGSNQLKVFFTTNMLKRCRLRF